MLTCPYCGKKDINFKADLEVHIRDEHPQMMKERGVAGYFQVLQNRDKSGYYVRQIAYWKKRR